VNALLPFVSNGIGIIILLILRYVSSTRVSKRRYADFLFNVMLFGIMGACVLEATSYAIDGKVFFGSILLNYLANTYLFTVNLLLPLSLVFYVDLSFFDDPRRMQHTYRPQILVSLIMLAATVANLFVPLCFKISDHNVYARLPFSYAYYVVILYHFVSALVVQLRYNRERGPRAFVSIELFLLPIVVGTSLQFAFYGLSLAWVASAIGLCGLFMMQQNELAYIDGLTGTYNRQYLYHMLTSWSRSHTPLVGAMCDVDRFKEINDTYGHSEGDHALTVVAGALT
jgi:GGDEF domain-containing protein